MSFLTEWLSRRLVAGTGAGAPAVAGRCSSQLKRRLQASCMLARVGHKPKQEETDGGASQDRRWGAHADDAGPLRLPGKARWPSGWSYQPAAQIWQGAEQITPERPGIWDRPLVLGSLGPDRCHRHSVLHGKAGNRIWSRGISHQFPKRESRGRELQLLRAARSKLTPQNTALEIRSPRNHRKTPQVPLRAQSWKLGVDLEMASSSSFLACCSCCSYAASLETKTTKDRGTETPQALEKGRSGFFPKKLDEVHVGADGGEERGGEIALAGVGQHGDQHRALRRLLGHLNRCIHGGSTRDSGENPLRLGQGLGHLNRSLAWDWDELVIAGLRNALLCNLRDEVRGPALDWMGLEGRVRAGSRSIWVALGLCA